MKTENLYTPNSIRTFTGKYFNIVEPDIDTIDIEDIAHSLSHQPRFAGHLPEFYSVAEHCLNCMDLAAPENKLQALLHDASEAYFLDIPKPYKHLINNYHQLEDGIMKLIAKKFSFEWPLCESVKKIDEFMLQAEWHILMLGKEPNGAIGVLKKALIPRKYVKADFLNAFYSLSNPFNSTPNP